MAKYYTKIPPKNLTYPITQDLKLETQHLTNIYQVCSIDGLAGIYIHISLNFETNIHNCGTILLCGIWLC